MSCKVNLLFLPYHNTGGHFVDWSINYVCGQDLSLDSTQQNTQNWHHHKSLFAHGYADLIEKFNLLKSSSNRKFENIYLCTLKLHIVVKQLFDTDIKSATTEQVNVCQTHIKDDTEKLLAWAQHHNVPIILLDYYQPDLFSIFYNNRFYIGLNDEQFASQHQIAEQHIDYFFRDNTKNFDQHEIWDQREMLALMYKFNEKRFDFSTLYNHSLPHLYYNTDDIWNNFPPVLEEICDELELEIIPEHFSQWQEIYKQWRNVHDPYFGRHLDRIVNSIVTGKYMSLKRFKLNFWQEVIIQHQLITQHNLNLKTWQLSKFPDNTLDLHKLLEENIH